MALLDQSFGQELAEIAEPNNGDFESVGFLVMGFDSGLVVKRLSCVDGSNSEALEIKMGLVFLGFASGRRYDKRVRD